MTKPLSLGKIHCLQQLTNEFDVFAMAAFDHRDVFVAALSQTLGVAEAAWETVAAEKIRIATALAPHASAVLLDPLYSAGPVLAEGVLPKGVGFAVAREKSSYGSAAMRETTALLEGWSVEAIRRMGGAGVKLLLHYHPDAPNAAAQEEVVRQVAAECDTYEIPLMLEPICYPLDPNQKKSDPTFAAQRPELVLESARRLVLLGVDILKAEFPTDADHETDETKMVGYCRRLSEISGDVPWVILSAGVDFTTFQRQVEIACEAGASGFVAGRAIWNEALDIANDAARDRFLNSTAVSRLRVLTDTANYRATSWRRREAGRIPRLSEGWYVDYK
ncbi:MAG: tagatose 1,6-diphosphate aldolase [Anaerolineales bacterium]|nr:tagatose 1,6-diphosphate aldolase [Anaerolineales bacterium]